MADRQLRLFAHAKPLLERMGPEFFRAAPRRPGVYLMTGTRGEVLYVGQSGNLRGRLNCYKNGNPDALPRRIVRLIHSVASITWEECASRQLARVRENELLRLHRPKFNRVNKYPQGYWFIGLLSRAEQLTLFRSRDSFSYERHVYGAFKGGAVYGFAALLRLVWSAIYQPGSPFELPRQLVSARPPGQFSIETETSTNVVRTTELTAAIDAYLNGESDELIESLTRAVTTERLSLFHRNLIESDLETLAVFFESGPRRVWRLKREHGIAEGLISKEELDDLMALSVER